MPEWIKKFVVGVIDAPARIIYAVISFILALSIVTSPSRGSAVYLSAYGVNLDYYALLLFVCSVASIIVRNKHIIILLVLPLFLWILALSDYLSTGQGSISGLAIYLGFFWLSVKAIWHDD